MRCFENTKRTESVKALQGLTSHSLDLARNAAGRRRDQRLDPTQTVAERFKPFSEERNAVSRQLVPKARMNDGRGSGGDERDAKIIANIQVCNVSKLNRDIGNCLRKIVQSRRKDIITQDDLDEVRRQHHDVIKPLVDRRNYTGLAAHMKMFSQGTTGQQMYASQFYEYFGS